MATKKRYSTLKIGDKVTLRNAGMIGIVVGVGKTESNDGRHSVRISWPTKATGHHARYQLVPWTPDFLVEHTQGSGLASFLVQSDELASWVAEKVEGYDHARVGTWVHGDWRMIQAIIDGMGADGFVGGAYKGGN